MLDKDIPQLEGKYKYNNNYNITRAYINLLDYW